MASERLFSFSLYVVQQTFFGFMAFVVILGLAQIGAEGRPDDLLLMGAWLLFLSSIAFFAWLKIKRLYACPTGVTFPSRRGWRTVPWADVLAVELPWGQVGWSVTRRVEFSDGTSIWICGTEHHARRIRALKAEALSRHD